MSAETLVQFRLTNQIHSVLCTRLYLNLFVQLHPIGTVKTCGELVYTKPITTRFTLHSLRIHSNRL